MHREYLGSDISVFTSESHQFGTDAILLADFSRPKKNDKVCDLGTGCGIIPMLWCRSNKSQNISAVDIQPLAIEQLNKAIEHNKLENVKGYNCDLRQIKDTLPHATLDLVTMNPPYKPVDSGIQSISEAEKIARHEVCCNIDDVVNAAKYLLKFGGRLCMCHRPERLCDIFVAMRNGNIEPKKIRFVCQHYGDAPWLVLVEGKLGGKSGLKVEKDLIMKNNDESDSAEIIEILGDYREAVEINKGEKQ